jgi:glucose/arabinose dehydrogenase
VRVTASCDKVVAGSEKLIFRLNNQDDPHHMGGALDFGADRKLYISTGDNVGGNTQTLQNLLGKMLRINKDGTIPTGNPFYASAHGQQSGNLGSGRTQPLQVRRPARHGHDVHKRRGR